MRKWFTIPSVLQLILSIGLIGIFLMQASNSSSHLILKELQGQMLKQVNDQLEQRLQIALQLNQIHVDAFRYGVLNLEDQTDRERYFVTEFKSFPDAAMTYIGLVDGSFYGVRRTATGEIQVVRNDASTEGASWYYKISKTGEGTELVDKFPNFDPRKRPWYLKAVEVGAPTLSSVYSHFVFREPTITASYPIYDTDGLLIGVFGVDYLLSWLGETLRDLPFGASGQVIVTDEEGMMIATSADIQTYKVVDGASKLIVGTEIDNPIIQATLAQPLTIIEKNLIDFKIDGKKYYAGASVFQEYGVKWTIYVVSAEDDFLSDVKKATTQSTIILAIAFLISIFFTSWVAGRVTKPIITLSMAAEELASGNLVHIPDDGRQDELGKLTRSFNKMGVQLTNMVANLEEEVAERTKELEERNEALKRLSFTDGLTGIANRRKFDETLQNAWNMALRHNRLIAMFMMDIDLFKYYNDTYGHPTGDECLKSIGRELQHRVRRSSDLVARFGGEEFVVLLQDVEIEHIEAYADEIRTSIEALEIEHASSPYHFVTISIGVAFMTPDIEGAPENLIKMADQALYQAKAKGRNQVVIYDNQSARKQEI